MERTSLMLRVSQCLSFLALLFIVLSCEAQYKGDHIPGFVGLESGSQAPPGIYVGNLVYVYPTDTIKANNGNSINLPGSLTVTADAILLSVVTNSKVLGGNVGWSLGFPFM